MKQRDRFLFASTHRPIRGRFAHLTIAVIAVLAISACSTGASQAPSQAASQAASQPATSTPSQASDAPTQGDVGGELDFLSWEGYDLPGIMTSWLDENGVTLTPTYPGNHDEIQAKLLGGSGGGTDIYTYYQGYKDFYTQLDILTPIDESKIPNLDGLLPFFASDVGNYWINEKGERTGVPWTWSINALTYDSASVDEPGSYYDLLEPAAKDRVAVVDDPLGAYTIGSLILGYDVTTLTPDQLKEVEGFLGKVLAQAKTVSPSYGDATTLLTSGEVDYIFPGWAAISSFAADAGKDTVKMAIPKEGGMVTVDAWALPPGADNTDTAYAWINQTLDPTINAAAADYLIGGTVVADSVDLLGDASKATYPYYDDLESLFSSVSLYGIPPQESDQYMTYSQMVDSWTALKAGS